jgi:transposase
LDLRERVIGHVENGGTARGAAGHFGIGMATAIRWVRDWRETGGFAPGPFGKPKGSKLDTRNNLKSHFSDLNISIG